MSEAPTPPAATPCATWYEVDQLDRVRAVSRDWDRFAVANDGPQACSHRVLGRPLRQFISGDATTMFMEAALQVVRVTGQVRELAYRCDAPDLRRDLVMTLEPLEHGAVRVTHHARGTTVVPQRQAVVTRPTGAATGEDAVWRCSRCLRLAPTLRGPWHDVPAADSGSPPLAVRYALCGSCRGVIAAELGHIAAGPPGT
jgi:hypothetical protein